MAECPSASHGEPGDPYGCYERQQMGVDMARAEESAVFDFLNWLAPQNVELHRLTSSGCATAAEGELLERWKTERRES